MTSTTCAIYTRISKDEEGTAEGVGRQLEDCQELAEQLDYGVVAVFEENDTSASTRSSKPRPTYEAMMRRAEAGEFGAILCYTTSRLTRRPLEYERLIGLVERRGTIIRTVRSGRVDLTTADGRMVARFLAAADAAEAERTSERLMRKFLENARQGEHHGARPFGFRKPGDGVLVIDEQEAELIREACSRVLAGESLRRICLDWNRRGITYRNERAIREGHDGHGPRWRGSNLRRLLLNPRHVAVRRHAAIGRNGRASQRFDEGEFYPGAWTTILDRDVWEQVCTVLRDPARVRNGGKVARANLLAGFGYCGRCASRLKVGYGNRGADGVRLRVYTCPPDAVDGRSSAGAGGGCVSRQADAVEEHVRNTVFHWLDSGAYEAAVGAMAQDANLRDLVARRDELDQRLARFDADYAAGDITAGEMRTAKAKVKAELTPITRELGRAMAEHTLSDTPERGADLCAAWESWDLARRRTLICAMVDRVVVQPTAKGRFAFNPADIEVVPGSWAEGVEIPPMAPIVLRPVQNRSPQRDTIRAYLLANPDADHTPPAVARALGLSHATVVRILNGFAESGEAVKTQALHKRGRPTYYRFAA